MMSPFRRLILHLDRYRFRLIAGVVCVLFSSTLSLAKPLIVGSAVDALTAALTRDTFVRFGLLYVAVAAGQGLFLFLQRWFIIVASREIEFDLRGEFYEHLQKLPLRFYHDHRVGDLMSRATNDLANARMLIGPAVMHSLSSVIVVFGAFFMMFRIDVPLASMSLVAFPVVAGAVKIFGAKLHDRSREVQDYFGDVSARVQENLTGVRVIRAFSQEENERRRYRTMNRELVNRNRALILLTAVFRPVLEMVIGTLFVAVFWMGSRRILAGSMSLGDFVAFQFYLARMIWPLIAFGWVINLFQRGMASMGRLNDIWNVRPVPDPPRSGEDLSRRQDLDVELRGLTFSYDGRPVLRGIDLTVPHGRTVGIVGPTGSAKSTLLSLLTRMYEAPKGTILIGGRPIESIPASELRSIVGAVPQETFLFSETIVENIRFGRSDASRDEAEAMAELAGLSRDLESFPRGIDTMVGERGITLSGGQKQRTAIARAVIRNPLILLLDDCLSAVDTHTEERILSALREVRRGRTVLIVSHRVSSVKDADQILVMMDGAIAERGSHEELVALDGWYANLYRRQMIEEEIEEIA